MKRSMKLLTTVILVGGVLTSTMIGVQAKTVSYLIKDKSTGTVYEYGVAELIDGFLNYKASGSDVLYNDFSSKLNKNGYYSFYDDTKKYVDYKDISNAFLEAKSNKQDFKLDTYTQSSSASVVKDLPSSINSVVKENGKITYVVKNNSTTSNELEVISIE